MTAPPGPPPWGLPPEGEPIYVAEPYTPYGYPTYPPYGYSPYGPPSPKPPPTRVADTWVGWGLLAAGILAILAAYLTWATVLGVGISGSQADGDGDATAFFGSVLAAMGVVIVARRGRLWTTVLACVVAGLITLVAGGDIANVTGVASRSGLDASEVSIGPGLWLTLAAGVAALGLSIMGIVGRNPQPDGR